MNLKCLGFFGKKIPEMIAFKLCVFLIIKAPYPQKKGCTGDTSIYNWYELCWVMTDCALAWQVLETGTCLLETEDEAGQPPKVSPSLLWLWACKQIPCSPGTIQSVWVVKCLRTSHCSGGGSHFVKPLCGVCPRKVRFDHGMQSNVLTHTHREHIGRI